MKSTHLLLHSYWASVSGRLTWLLFWVLVVKISYFHVSFRRETAADVCHQFFVASSCSMLGPYFFFFFFRNPEHIAEATVGTSWGMYFLVEHLGGQSMVKYVVKMKMKMVMKLGFYCFVRYVLCRVSG